MSKTDEEVKIFYIQMKDCSEKLQTLKTTQKHLYNIMLREEVARQKNVLIH